MSNSLELSTIQCQTVNNMVYEKRTVRGHGSGIADAAVKTESCQKVNNFIISEIKIDLAEGLACGGAAGDVIGTDGGEANAYIMELDADVTGVPILFELFCLETPDGGDPDINVSSSATGTTAENAALTSGTTIMNNGDLSAGFYSSAGPGATVSAGAIDKQYIYLTCGTATQAAYTAGQIVLRVTGVEAI